VRLRIASTWNGIDLHESQIAEAELLSHSGAMTIRIDAPFANDPAPPIPSGRCDGLWNFEVVEFFFVARDHHYLEIEVGPFGHYLVIEHSAIRQRQADQIRLHVSNTSRHAQRWRTEVSLSHPLFMQPLVALNAFRISGPEHARSYFAAFPCGGDAPDFHRIDDYPRLLSTDVFAPRMP
jgi:hypothetical protein